MLDDLTLVQRLGLDTERYPLENLPKPDEERWVSLGNGKPTLSLFKPSIHLVLEPLFGKRQIMDRKTSAEELVLPSEEKRIFLYRQALGIVYRFKSYEEDLMRVAVYRRQVTDIPAKGMPEKEIAEIDIPLFLLVEAAGNEISRRYIGDLAQRMPRQTWIERELLLRA